MQTQLRALSGLGWGPRPGHGPCLSHGCHWALPALPMTDERAEAAETATAGRMQQLLRRHKREGWSFFRWAGVEIEPGKQGGCSTRRLAKLGFSILFKMESRALDNHLGTIHLEEALCSWLCVCLYRCHVSLATAFVGKLVSVLLLFAINSPAI